MSKLRLATVWLDGCSGCHMSFLDMDERLIELSQVVEVVYSPLVDAKEYPDNVDVALVEGAVATNEDLARIRNVRARTRIVAALGDCAVTANVPGMRNGFSVKKILERAYQEHADAHLRMPGEDLPVLLDRVTPAHEAIPVDLFVPGCPPSADTIHFLLRELIAGRKPDLSDRTRFGV